MRCTPECGLVFRCTMGETGFPRIDDGYGFSGQAATVTNQTGATSTPTSQTLTAGWHALAVLLSSQLINANGEAMDTAIDHALQRVCALSGDDRAFISLFSRDGESMDTPYEWCAEGVTAQAHRLQGRPVASLPWLTRQIRDGQSVMVSDIDQLPAEASLDQEESRVEHMRAVLLLPLRFAGQVVGILGLSTVERPHVWQPDVVESLQLIADLLTGGLARKQAEEDLRDAQQLLEKRVEERERATARSGRAGNALRDILQVLNSNRALSEVLDYVALQSCKLLNASATLIRRADLQRERVTSAASYQLPDDFDAIRDTRLYYNANDLILMSRRPVLIANLRATYAPVLEMDTGLDEVQKAYVQALLKHFSGMLSVPLFIREEIFGSLVFFFREHRSFSEEDIQLAMSLGDQAALAIENARLRAESEQNAVLMERNRLARDLHDAVTQTLFSASLIAEVLPRIWERDPQEGWRRLEELRQLSRGALAEMRTLLLELRPSALTEARLSDLLRQLSDAVSGRARLPVNLSVENEFDLHPDVQVFFYRIAQEALNNVLKHSGATRVDLRLQFTYAADVGRSVRMRIDDNGRGFNPAEVPSNHLGLGIMRERAQAVGAELQVESAVGRGTVIEVIWRETV